MVKHQTTVLNLESDDSDQVASVKENWMECALVRIILTTTSAVIVSGWSFETKAGNSALLNDRDSFADEKWTDWSSARRRHRSQGRPRCPKGPIRGVVWRGRGPRWSVQPARPGGPKLHNGGVASTIRATVPVPQSQVG